MKARYKFGLGFTATVLSTAAFGAPPAASHIMEEIVVTAPYPAHLLMEEIVVTAPMPVSLLADHGTELTDEIGSKPDIRLSL